MKKSVDRKPHKMINSNGLLTKWSFLESLRTGVELHKLAKTEERNQYPSHLDQTSLVNKGFIMWLSGKYFLAGHGG